MKRIVIALLIGLIALSAWVVGTRGWTPSAVAQPAQTGKAVNAVTGTAEVLAEIDIEVKARQYGTIVEALVGDGQVVEQGEPMMLQDSATLQLQIEHLEIRLAAALERKQIESRHRVDLEALDEQLDGVRLTVELGQAPATRLEQLLRERRKLDISLGLETINAREQVDLLQNQLQQLQLQLKQMTTTAPFSGRVAVLRAFPGDLVNPGQGLLRLISHGRVVRLELTEEDYAGIAVGQQVVLRLASFPDRVFRGSISFLEGVANASTKTRNAFVALDGDASVLVPGLTGEGLVTKAEREDAVLIPRRALLGDTVYVVVDGRVDVRRVQPGFIGLNQAEIRSGVEAGELVIVEEQSSLRHGQRVRVELN
jgi:RND family efflux transporter MFP subunit